LELFSVKGYGATSVSMIADAVGIRKASLYNHFESKQALLDELIASVIDEYNRHSMFVNVSWDDEEFTRDKTDLCAHKVAVQVKLHLRYILHDPTVSRGRKMLMIEQFSNPELGKLLTKMNYDDVMSYHVGMMRFFIKNGVLRDAGAETMAAQFCLPISAWLNLCDRENEPERELEAKALVDKHIANFFELYKA